MVKSHYNFNNRLLYFNIIVEKAPHSVLAHGTQ